MRRYYLLIFLFLFLLSPHISVAQDVPPAVPVGGVVAQPLESKLVSSQDILELFDGRFTVLEFYARFPCRSCAEQEHIFRAATKRQNMVALNCYAPSDVEHEQSLALPICQTRSAEYERALGMPAVVFDRALLIANGQKTHFSEVIDYPKPLAISFDGQGQAEIELPNFAPDTYKIWLFVYADKEVDGVRYPNVVTKAGYLGGWDGRAKILRYKPKLEAESKGYTILVQHSLNQKIIAAAKFER